MSCSKLILGSFMLSIALSVLSLGSITPVYGPEQTTCYPGCIHSLSLSLKIRSYDPKSYVAFSGSAYFVTINASAFVTDQYGSPVKGAWVYVVIDGTKFCSSTTNKHGINNSSTADCTETVVAGYHSWYLLASLSGYTSGKTPTYSFHV